MSEDNYTPGATYEKFFIDCAFYCEHRFHMAVDRLDYLPADWRDLLDRLNNGTDVATIRRGPLYRILAFRWLNPETAPGIHSLN